jgi:Fe2+ or Zn2+ uptake regulation protein
MQSGAVHQIKALGAFVACNCTASHKHAISVLAVCSGCDGVEELHDHGVIHHLEKLRLRGIPLSEHAVIELPVTCKSCTA